MRVYVCGPVTGVPDRNLPTFEEAAHLLVEKGHEPVVPHDYVPAHAEWSDAMKICLSMMLECDAITILPEWRKSRGARLELSIAVAVGLKRISTLF